MPLVDQLHFLIQAHYLFVRCEEFRCLDVNAASGIADCAPGFESFDHHGFDFYEADVLTCPARRAVAECIITTAPHALYFHAPEFYPTCWSSDTGS